MTNIGRSYTVSHSTPNSDLVSGHFTRTSPEGGDPRPLAEPGFGFWPFHSNQPRGRRSPTRALMLVMQIDRELLRFAEDTGHIRHHKSRVRSDKYGKRLSEISVGTEACPPRTCGRGCWASVHLESPSGQLHVDYPKLTSTNLLGSTDKTASSSGPGCHPSRSHADATTQPSCSTTESPDKR
jgi:hypothetical protein